MKGLFTQLRLLLPALLLTGLFQTQAQDQGFIYGTVITDDGEEYTGPIRWGDEEVYWSDMFNASKRENKNIDYLSSEELDNLKDRRSDNNVVTRLVSISWDWDDDFEFVHEFSTAFGNIKSIEVRGSERVELELKNSKKLYLDGSGYNDVGAKISVIDHEIGRVTLSWRDVEFVEFKPTPKKLNSKFGEPMYGTVKCDIGEFTGYVQWDHDERLGSDELDGDTRDADVSIPFDKIRSIERDGYSRSLVVLKSGKELELRGSNDVNDENRGIIVNVDGLGRVDIDWDEFDMVTFSDAPDSGQDYNSYAMPELIRGTVLVDNGDKHEGEIIYDLDEEYTIEVLNGEDDDTKFIIPFMYIKEIKPRYSDSSEITLKSGDKLVLEDAQDVGEDNTGILIKTKDGRIYVPWDRVEKVTFN